MSALGGVAAVMALAILLIAGVVFGLGDSTILVPPPESVAEGFVRELVTRRYERALPYLSEELRAQVSAEDLRKYTEPFKNRSGKILNVRGEPGRMAGDRAEAYAIVEAKSGGVMRFAFELTRQKGVWAISKLDENFMQ